MADEVLPAIRVLLATKDREGFEALNQQPGGKRDVQLVGNGLTEKAVFELLHQHRPDILVIDADLPELNAFEVAEQIHVENLDTAVIIVSQSQDQRMLKRAMQVGAEEYLVKPVDPETAQAALQDVMGILEKRRQKRRASEAQEAAAGGNQVIMLCSGKGGVGKTTLSANLAVALAQETGKSVALVDLYLGDSAVLVNAKPRLSLHQIPENSAQVDLHFLEAYGVKGPAGITVFAAYVEPELGIPEPLSWGQIQTVIQTLRMGYGFLVVDYNVIVHPAEVEMFTLGDIVLVVGVSWDLLSLRVTKALITSLKKHPRVRDKVRLVLNRFQKDSELTDADIQRILDTPVFFHIPNDTKVVVASVNTGQPCVIHNPDSDVSRAVRRLARTLAGVPAEPERKKKFLFFGA